MPLMLIDDLTLKATKSTRTYTAATTVDSNRYLSSLFGLKLVESSRVTPC